MNRRAFTALAAGSALAAAAADQALKPAILELRYLMMRNTAADQMRRASGFLSEGAAPALRRAGVGPLGFFTSVIAPESPFILALAGFPSLAAMETAREREAADPEYIKARAAYNGAAGRGYERLQSSLVRCFEGLPRVEIPPDDGARPARIFELRTYESDNGSTLARKIKMFNDAEISIFRRLGMRPVFFGETIVGARMPNLVYMLSFDDLAAREAAWKAFGADPEWQKLRARPGNSDAELVSNISNMILRPLPFSQIR